MVQGSCRSDATTKIDETMERDLRRVLDTEAAEVAVTEWHTLATAVAEQARVAYKRLARRIHPDKLACELGGDGDDAGTRTSPSGAWFLRTTSTRRLSDSDPIDVSHSMWSPAGLGGEKGRA